MDLNEIRKQRDRYLSMFGDSEDEVERARRERDAYIDFNQRATSFDYGKSLNDEYNSFVSSDGYKSADTFNTYKQKYDDLRKQAQRLKDDAQIFGGGADYIKSLDDFLSSTNNIGNSIDSVASHYSQFKGEDDYNSQLEQAKQYDRTQQLRNEIYTKYRNAKTLADDLKQAKEKFESNRSDRQARNMYEHLKELAEYRSNNIQDIERQNKYQSSPDYKQNALQGLNKLVTDKRSISDEGKVKTASRLATEYQNKDNAENPEFVMSDEEAKMLGSIYANEGLEQAEKYAKQIQERINYAKGKETAETIKNVSDKVARGIVPNYNSMVEIGDSVGDGSIGKEIQKMSTAIGGGIYSGVTTSVNGLADFFSSDAKPTRANEYASSIIGEELNEGDFKILGRTPWKGLYEFTSNTVAQVPQIALGTINPAIGLGEMFVQASGNAKQSALREGASEGQATLYGLLNGTSEVALQKVLGGIPQLVGAGNITENLTNALSNRVSSAVGKAVVSLGGHTAGEFTEEYLQEVLDPVFKNLTYKDGEEVKLFSEEALYAGILGALSAGAFSGVGIMSEAKHQLDLGKGLKETNFIETAKAISQNAELPKTLTNEINKLDVNTGNGRVGGIAQNLTNYLQKNAETKLADALGEKYTVADAQDIINSQYGIVSNNLVDNLMSDSHYAEVANAFGQGEFGGKEIQAIENVMQQWVVSGRNSSKSNPIVDAMTKNNQEQIIQTVEQNNKEMTQKINSEPLSYDALTESEKKLKDTIKETLGLDIDFAEDLGNEQGHYSRSKDNVIISRKAKNPMLEVLLHEMAHAGQKSNEWGNFVKVANKSKLMKGFLEKYNATNIDAIADIITANRWENYKERISESEAKEEAYAYFASYVFSEIGEEQFIKDMEELAKENPKEHNAIIEFLKSILDKIRSMFGNNSVEVKNLEKLYLDAIKTRETETNTGEKQNSYAGDLSRTADLSLLQQAKELDEQGADSEEIRQKTGWFKGYDGMWRYEIDDKDITVDFTGKNSRNPDLKRYNELEYKFLMGEISNDENSELQTLSKNLEGVNKTPTKLGDIVSHTKLFEAYPDLADIDVRVEYAPNLNIQAGYSPSFNEIVVNRKYMLNKSKLKKVLIHEIQHAIQDIEGFSNGTNTQNAENYQNNAGEIEARDVANRIDMTAEQRKNTRPDIDRSDVVFADEKQYSKQDDLEYLELAKEPEKNEARLREMVASAFMSKYGDTIPSELLNEDGTPKVFYHGTRDNFTVFELQDKQKFGRVLGDGFYFTPDYDKAFKFANGLFSKGQDRGGIIMPTYLKISNPYVIEPNSDRTKWRKEYTNGNYDGIIDLKNNTYFVETSSQIKSADLVTYDDNGNIIPLSERFNSDNDDIRYSKMGDLMSLSLEAQTAIKERKELKKEVNNLSKEVDKWKNRSNYWKGETRRTKNPEVDSRSLEKVVGSWLNGRGLSADNKSEILTEVKEVYDRILQDRDYTGEEALADLKEIAEGINYWSYNGLSSYEKEALHDFKASINPNNGKSWYISDNLYRELESEYDGYKNFKKAFSGILRTTRNRDTGVTVGFDVLYNYLSEEFPAWFNMDAQPRSTTEVLEAIREAYEFYSNGIENKVEDEEAMNAYTRDELFDMFFDVANRETFADKQYKKLQNIRKEFKGKLQAQKEKLTDKYTKQLKEQQERYDNRLNNYKDDIRIKEYKKSIISISNNLRRMLENPTKEKHISSDMINTVAPLVETIDALAQKGDSYNALNNLLTEYEKLKDTELYNPFTAKMIEDLLDPLGDQTMGNEVIRQKNQLIEDLYVQGDFKGITEAEDSIKAISKEIKLSADNWKAINNVVRSIRHSVITANAIFRNGRTQNASRSAQSIVDQIGTNAKVYKVGVLSKLFEKNTLNLLRPNDVWRFSGSNELYAFYKDLLKGQDISSADQHRFKEFFQKEAQNAGWNSKWTDIANGLTWNTMSGDIDLSIDEALSIYLTSLQEDGMAHLTNGGFTLDRRAKGLKETTENVKPYVVSEEDIDILKDILNDKQKGFADALQKYLYDVGEDGNKVTRTLYDLEMFGKNKRYFPLNVNRDFLPSTEKTITEEYKAGASKISSPSWTKSRVKNAKQPLNIGGVTRVVTNHINEMANFHGYAIPMSNFRKVMNIKDSDTANGTRTYTAIKNALGANYASTIKRFVDELDGNGSQVERNSVFDKALSLSKKGMVAASMSVGIQQCTAIVRAASEIDSKYLFKGALTPKNLIENWKPSTWQEMLKHSGVARVKDFGFIDVDMSGTYYDWVTSDYDKGIKNVRDKIDDVSQWFPAKMDMVTWSAIWDAVKREVKDTSTLSGEVFWDKVNERFTEIIDKTQVYDSLFARSEIMRSKNGFVKAGTAFMSEPLTTLSMIYSNIALAKGGKQKAKAIGKMSALFLVQSALVASLYALPKAGRDDDENKTWLQKYFSALGGKLGDELNVLNLIPLVKDAVSIANGFSVERMDTALFTDAYNAIKGLSNADENNIGSKLIDAINSFTAFLGIPTKNVTRDIRMIANTVSDITSDGKTTTAEDVATALIDGFLESVPFMKTTEKSYMGEKDDAYDNAVKLLKDVQTKSTEHKNLIPTKPNRNIDVGNGEKVSLSKDDFDTYVKESGELIKQYVNELHSISAFNSLSADEQVEVIKDVKSYATNKAKTKVSSYELNSVDAKVEQFENAGVSADEVITANVLLSKARKEKGGSLTKKDEIKVIKESNLPSHAKELLAKVKEMQNTKDADEKIKAYLQSK